MKLLDVEPEALTKHDYKIPQNNYGHFQLTAHPIILAQGRQNEYLQILRNSQYSPTARAIALWLYEWSFYDKPQTTNQVFHATTACKGIYKQKQIKSFLWYLNEINITSNFWHGLHTTLFPPTALTINTMKKRSDNPDNLKILTINLNFSLFNKNTKVFVQQRFAPQEVPVIQFSVERLDEDKTGQLLLKLIDKYSKQLDELAQAKLKKYLEFRVLITILGLSLGISNFAVYTKEILGTLFPHSAIQIKYQGGHRLVAWSLPAKFDLEKAIKKIPEVIYQIRSPEILNMWQDLYEIIKNYYFTLNIPARLWLLLYQYNNITLLLNWLKSQGELSSNQTSYLKELIRDINSQLLLEEYLYARQFDKQSYFINLEPNDSNNNFVVLKQDNLPVKIKCKNKTFSATLRVEL